MSKPVLTTEQVRRTLEKTRRGPDAIEIERLVRRYGDREALVDVSLQLRTGETLVVFGPNGAGKTTLLRLLATLLIPNGGSVRVLSFSLPLDAPAVRPLVGLLGHEPMLYRDLSGRENLRFYARLYGIATAEERIDELLATVAVSRRADEPLRGLSRGMVQRLAVCRAVLHKPQLLLLDEPHAGLDPDAQLLAEPLIGAQSDATRVLVTHDTERGLAEADRVLGLRDGRVVFAEDAAHVSTDQVAGLYRGARP
jgi:heme exporter protein A